METAVVFSESSGRHAEHGLTEVVPVIDAHDFFHVHVGVVLVQMQTDGLQERFVKLSLHFGALESELVQRLSDIHEPLISLVGAVHGFGVAVESGHVLVELRQLL